MVKEGVHLHLLSPQFLIAMGLATWMTWFPVYMMTTNLYKTKK